MAIRKVTVEKLREIVTSRLTRGASFMMSHEEYHQFMVDTRAMLDLKDFKQIKAEYPHLTEGLDERKG
jgi:hypothetical protein